MERDQERQAYSQRQSKVQYEHCPGYTDKYGIWNNGFNCPRWGGTGDDYCCGNERERFCCPPPQQHDNDESSLTTPFNNNNNNNNNNNVMVVYPQDQPSPTVTVPVLMIATGAGIVLAIIVVIATVCLCCLFCRCCRNQKSKFFKSSQKDLMNQEAAKISSAIETQAMTSSRPRTPSSVHMTTSRVVDISNFKESRFSFSNEEDIVNVDSPGIVQVGRWNGHGDSMKKSTRDLDFINLPPISDEREHPNFFNNDNFRLHESIMTTSDYHSSSPLTGQPNNTNSQHHHHNGNNSSGSSSATLGRNQHHKQRCQLHQHHSSASSCLSPSQQQQVASIQSQGAMKRLTFDLLHSLSPGLQRHYVESGGKAEGHQSPYLGSKFN